MTSTSSRSRIRRTWLAAATATLMGLAVVAPVQAAPTGTELSYVTISCPTGVVYDGASHVCTAAAYATADDILITTITPTYAPTGDPVDAGAYDVDASFAGDETYAPSSDSTTFGITPADTTTTIDCTETSVPYVGSAYNVCTATVWRGETEVTTVQPSYDNNTDAGTVHVDAVFEGDANHYGSTAEQVTFEITKADTTVALTCPGSVAYTGSAQEPCTGAVTFNDGEADVDVPAAELTWDYADNTDVGTASVRADYAGGDNFNSSYAEDTFDISAAATVVEVTCPASVVFNGTAQEPTCTVVVKYDNGTEYVEIPGASVTWIYSNNTNVGTATAHADYAGGGNYQASDGEDTFAITAAPTAIVYTGSVLVPQNLNASLKVAGIPSYCTADVTYNFTMGAETHTITGAAAATLLQAVSTWTFGIWDLTVSYPAGNCAASSDSATMTVYPTATAAGLKVAGGGWYTQPSLARSNFGVVLQAFTKGTTVSYKGQLVWVNKHLGLRFKGNVVTDYASVNGTVTIVFTGTMYKWVVVDDIGSWQVAKTGATATALLTPTTPSLKKKPASPGTFSLRVDYVPDGALTSLSTGLQSLNGGSILVK